MAILWFLSCLALLTEASGQSCRDKFLGDENVQYVIHIETTRVINTCNGSIFNTRWATVDSNGKIILAVERNGADSGVSKQGIMRMRLPINHTSEDFRICLASSSDVFNNGDNCVTTNMTYTCDSSTSANNQQGAGQKSTEDTSSNSQEVTVPILTEDECEKHWGAKNKKNEICTGLSSCMVDSGAGLLCKRNENWIMAGIASSSCSKSKPAIFRHMSAF